MFDLQFITCILVDGYLMYTLDIVSPELEDSMKQDTINN